MGPNHCTLPTSYCFSAWPGEQDITSKNTIHLIETLNGTVKKIENTLFLNVNSFTQLHSHDFVEGRKSIKVLSHKHSNIASPVKLVSVTVGRFGKKKL